MMLFDNAPIRLYTPPTCTLKLWDKRPLLSRWHENNILDNLEFELNFDDPRLLEDQQVTIKGDRSQLELLYDVVTSYVQNFLCQTSRCLMGSEHPSNQPESYSEEEPRSSWLPEDHPALSPSGLLTHKLNLGALSNQATHPTINLSASQLFDLLNALEEYSDSIVAIVSSKAVSPRKTLWVWSAATIAALLAILIPTVGVQWVREINSSESSVTENPKNKDNSRSFLDVLPPVSPAPNKSISQPSLDPNLANRDPLPPPSQIGQGTAPLRNPNIAIQAPPLRVLPPPPVAPPAPPKPNTANYAPNTGNYQVPVHLLPNGETPIVMPALPPGTVAEMMRQPSLPSPPTLQARVPNQRSPRDTLTIPNELRSQNEVVAVKPSPNMTLLDAIPQVAEAREYLQQRWQPPKKLAQTLEYRLIVQSDGALKQAIPLGKAAALYTPQTGIPAPGTAFVSSLDVPGNQTIRLVLSPNGTVKTFLE
ncbi:DUF4335 domain-containing protein [Crocosphaera sp. XPORK-15E]|uniref:DUF4335 domain-containing protein n=1 Tax=Crocosphaera sp. XPORK-15E TaxID=3110247 RepID=UPI002B219129|nr:DUF4335 domain-containing protein [Crocosphaera sp. XPORK-15E]MEA5536386.1 DUF4335 domain-containing protein [Crocosphaera sp. XPORK-15E]